MKLLFKFILFFFYFRSLPFCFIDPDIKEYFNQDYIKEIEEYFNSNCAKSEIFYLFQVNENLIEFVQSFENIINGKTHSEDIKFTIYRSTNKLKCQIEDEKTNKNILKENVYLDIIIENSFFSEYLLCVDNPNDNPEKIFENNKLMYKDKSYIKIPECCQPMLFKLKVKDIDQATKATSYKEICFFCSSPNPLYLEPLYSNDKNNKFYNGNISMFNSEKIIEFHLIDPLITIENFEYTENHKNDKERKENEDPDDDNFEENDYKNRFYYDDDDKWQKAEIIYEYLFKDCLNLEKISFDKSNFNTYMRFCSNNIFQGCKKLEDLGISNIVFTNFHFFRGFENLKSLKLYYENSGHQYSFANCKNLEEIKFVDLSGTEKVIDEMKLSNAGFKNCPNLSYIGAKKIVIDSKWGNTSIFENCKKLKIPDVVVLLHKNVNLEYTNLKNIFKGLDPDLNKEVKLEFKYVDDSSKIRYNLDFNTIFNGCDSKKNIEITTPDGQKQILKDVQNNDKIDEFLLNPVRYNKYRTFYQKITKEQLVQYNYLENIDIDDENIRNSILNNTYTDIINNINQDIKKDLDKDIPKPNPCCLCCGKCFTNCCCCKSKT